jgi:hypothetical protein
VCVKYNGQGNNKGSTGNTGEGNQASGKRNKLHGNRNNRGYSTTRIDTQIDKAFKDDSAELGVMMHKYFDCSGLHVKLGLLHCMGLFDSKSDVKMCD